MPTPARVLCLVCLVCLLAGCDGDEPSTPPDAGGSPSDTGTTGVEVTAPAPPMFGPCPTGWREATVDGTTHCEPFPESGPADCTDIDEAHFAGEPGCMHIGSVCPADGLPADLPADQPAVYVRAGSTGGDGTRALPYGTLTEFAWGGLRSDSVVAVGAGTYGDLVVIPPRVTVWGACVADTELTSAEPAPGGNGGVVTTRGAGAVVRNLRFGPSARIAAWIGGRSAPDYDLRLESVVVGEATAIALLAQDGGLLSGHEVVVRDTQPLGRDFGRALHVQFGGTMDLERAVLERNRDVAAFAGDPRTTDPTTLRLADLVVRDTGSRTTGDMLGGGAFGAQQLGQLEIRRAAIVDNRHVGVFVEGVGSTVLLEDTVVRNTQSQSDDSIGRGASIQEGAVATLTRVLFDGNRDIGFYCAGDGGEASFEDVVVRGTEAEASDLTGGSGAHAQRGCTMRLSRVVSEGNRAIGVFADSSPISIADVLVRDTRSQLSDGHGGRGINIQATTATVERATLERNLAMSFFAGVGATVTATDLLVTDTMRADCATGDCADGSGGIGVGSYMDATLDVQRFAVQRAVLCGVHVALGASLFLADGEVAESSIGACVQVAGYDLDRIIGDVAYRDNDTNLEATDLPVPMSLPTAGGV